MSNDPQNPANLSTGHYDSAAINRARNLLDAMPENVGPYRILERLGSGGMGEVYRAEQRSPMRRDVALKFIKLGMDTKQVIARFEAERQALALMDHPHIAKVFDAGADDTGRPYFVMEYVKGKPITEYADQNHLSIAERLELFEQVCQAVQHAHHKGVIHRDLKPGNVLVSTQDGKPFSKVIDFGIAKATAQRLTDHTLFTEHAQFVGTPQYMSPEQAEGSVDIDTRTDVYSLGVMLYELLTGSTPFSSQELKAAAFEQIKKMIVEVDPPKPSTRLSVNQLTLVSLAASRRIEPKRLGSVIRGELDWIVMKSLEKDRKRRYETPVSLANDIQAHLKGEPVKAAPPSTAYRIQKFAMKHRGPVIAIATVGIVLILGILGTSWGYYRAERNAVHERVARAQATHARDAEVIARQDAEQAEADAILAQRRAESEREMSQTQGYRAALLGAAACLDRDEWTNARRLLDDAPRSKRNWEWAYLYAQLDDSFLQLRGHTGQVNSLVFNSESSIVLSASDDGTARLWTIETGKLLQVFKEDRGKVVAAAFQEESRRIVTATIVEDEDKGSSHVVAHTWDLQTGMRLMEVIGKSSAEPFVAISSNGLRIATSSKTEVMLWDATTGRSGPTIPIKPGDFSRIDPVLSLDGSKVGVAVGEFEFSIFHAESGQQLSTTHRRGERVCAAAFSPDGTRFVTGEGDGTARVWETATGNELFVLPGHERMVDLVQFNANGSRLLTTDWDGKSRIWDLTNGKRLNSSRNELVFEGYPKFSPDGASIVTAGGYSWDFYKVSPITFGQIWDVDTGTRIGILNGHESAAGESAFSPDGRFIANTDRNGTLRVWNNDNKTGSPQNAFRAADQELCVATFAPKGETIVSFTIQQSIGDICILDSHSCQPVEVVESNRLLGFASVSPSGAWVVTDQRQVYFGKRSTMKTSQEGTRPAVFNSVSGREHGRLLGHSATVRFTQVSPDDSKIVTASEDRTARIWDLQSLRTIAVCAGHSDIVWSASFSPDGARVVTASKDGTARIWNAENGQQISVLRCETGLSEAVYSPDGKRILVFSNSGTSAELWDPTTCVRIARIPTGDFRAFASFSPDGSQFVAGGEQGVARIWDSSAGRMLAELHGHEGGVISAGYSPDAKRIVTGSHDATIRVWDTDSARELIVLRAHKKSVNSVSFSSNGDRLLSASSDGTVRVWDCLSAAERNQSQLVKKKVRKTVLPTVEELLDSDANDSELIEALWNDDSLSVDQKRVGRVLLRNKIAELKSEANQRFEKLRLKCFVDKTAVLAHGLELNANRREKRVASKLRGLIEGWTPTASNLNEAAWHCIAVPGRGSEEYALALAAAEEANRLDAKWWTDSQSRSSNINTLVDVTKVYPGNAAYINTLGVAYYRVGEFRKAIEALTNSEMLESYPSNLIVISMAKFCIGEITDAQSILERVRQNVESHNSSFTEEDSAFFEEANALINSNTTNPPAPSLPE